MDSKKGQLIYSNGFSAVKQCRLGLMVYPKHDRYIGGSLDKYGEFSHQEAALFEQVLQPGAVALDIGANIGAHTLLFAQKVGPTGRVYGFEPQRVPFQMLCANITLNSLANTYCLQQAVGEAPGTIIVPNLDLNQDMNVGGMSLGEWDQGDKVSVITLDSLDVPHCELIKVDVEGMEVSVFKGGQQFVKQHRPMLYVENDRKEHSAELIALIQSLDYKLYWHLPYLYNKDNYFADAENIFPNILSINMFCVPAESQIVMDGFREITDPNERWDTTAS